METSTSISENGAVSEKGIAMKESKKTKPSLRQRLLRPRIEYFIILQVGITFFNLLGGVHFGGSVRMLEKQYGFRTRLTGFLASTDNIFNMFMVLIVGYLGDKFSKPRIIAVSAVVVGIAYYCHALPYFALPVPKLASYEYGNSTSSLQNITSAISGKSTDVLCREHEAGKISEICQEKQKEVSEMAWTNDRAFYILIVARLLRGLGGATYYNLGTAYISDNTEPSKTSLFIGIMTSMYAIGPVCGFLLAGFCNRLPLDLKDWSLTPEDPRFLGAWWLGFLIAGSLMLLFSIPMFFFPESLKPKTEIQADGADKTEPVKEKKPILEHIKDVFRALRRLTTRRGYAVYVLAYTFFILSIISHLFNMQRYFEIHFRMPIYKANYITGGASATAGMVGALGGGYIMSRLRMRTVTIAKCLAFLTVFMVIMIGAMMAFTCPQLTYAGTNYPDTGVSRISVSTPCSEACGCDVSASQPVCGSDGKDYFTPCHAGCTIRHGTLNEGNFTSCACVEGGTATVGTCPMKCNMVIPYAISLCLMALAAALSRVPKTVILLRILPKDVKSFGLGINSFLYNILGFLPAPIIFGRLIDDTCDIWQEKCGQTGSCLLYNIGRFRNVTHGSSAVFKGVSAILTILGWWLIRNMHFSEDEEKETPKKTMLRKNADKEKDAGIPMLEEKTETKEHTDI